MEENKNELNGIENADQNTENEVKDVTPEAAEAEKAVETAVANEEIAPAAEEAAPVSAADPEPEAVPTPVEKEPVSEKPTEQKADSIEGDYTGNDVSKQNDHSLFQPLHGYDDSLPIDDQIGGLAADSIKKMNKVRIQNGICMGAILVVLVAIMLVTFLTRGNENLAWVQWTVLGVGLVLVIACFVLSSLISKKNGKIANEYLYQYQDKVDSYVLNELEVQDANLALDAKIEDYDIIQAHYFCTINHIESRCIVEGKRHDYGFRMGEVSVSVPPIKINDCNRKPTDFLTLQGTPYVPAPITATVTGTQEVSSRDMTLVDLDVSDEAIGDMDGKKRAHDIAKSKEEGNNTTSSAFFGRMHAYDMSVQSDEAFIIAYTGVKEYTYLPDFLKGYSPIKVTGIPSNIVIYAVNPKKCAVFFDEKGVELLNDISVNPTVSSLFISCNSYGSKVGFNLSDDIMMLPRKQTLTHLGCFDLYKDDLVHAFAFLDYVDSKRSK